MVRFSCRDYGFECNFVSEGEDAQEAIKKFGKHSSEEYGIEYSKEALTQFIVRKGLATSHAY
jgi:predicted small metal-binding protein